MSTAVIAPVNPMSAEGKQTVMSVMRRDRANFIRVVSDPKNWEVQTRCTEWETRDLVGHMIDVLEGYMKNWDEAKKGGNPQAAGLPCDDSHVRILPALARVEGVHPALVVARLSSCRPSSLTIRLCWRQYIDVAAH